jgi:hypothetical protein
MEAAHQRGLSTTSFLSELVISSVAEYRLETLPPPEPHHLTHEQRVHIRETGIGSLTEAISLYLARKKAKHVSIEKGGTNFRFGSNSLP